MNRLSMFAGPQLQQYVPTVATNLYGYSRLNKGYLGPVFRVRRSSDNAEQDCYSQRDLSTFCAGTNGFVRTRYDQRGTDDLARTVVASQPKIFDSVTGAVLDGTNLSATFDGTDDNLGHSAPTAFLGNPAFTIATLLHNTDAGLNNRAIWFVGQRVAATGDFLGVVMNGTDGKLRVLSTAINVEWTPVVSVTAFQSWVISKPNAGLAGASSFRQNGTALVQFLLVDGTLNILTSTPGSDYIDGALDALAGGQANFWQGNDTTLATWATTQLSGQDLTSLEAYLAGRRVS